ncbi:MAG: pitrilysin family protein [Ignavibacteria bacterium]
MNQYNRTILPNGIKILSENVPYVKSFSLGFWFNVGSRDENSENNGITHFIEHMLFKGTKKRSPGRIANDIEGYGGYLNAFTSKEHTCYYGRGLSDYLEKTFDVLADMVQFPAFKPAEIKKEAGVVVDELYDIEDNPEELIFDKFEESLFAGDSLGLPVIGTEKNIRGFSQSGLFDFIDRKYGFDTFIIAASGAVEHKKLVRFTEKYIKKDFGRKPVSVKNVPVNPGSKLSVEKEIQQVHTIIGRPTYGYNDKKRNVVNVLSHILGEGSSSRLFQTVRERNGICYQLNTFLNSFYDVSSFGVYFSTNDKLYEKSLGLILHEFKKIREKKVSDKELKKAKEYLKGSMLLSLESLTQRQFRMAQSEIYFNEIRSIEQTIAEIDAVTPQEVFEMANEVLEESALSKIIIKSGS